MQVVIVNGTETKLTRKINVITTFLETMSELLADVVELPELQKVLPFFCIWIHLVV